MPSSRSSMAVLANSLDSPKDSVILASVLAPIPLTLSSFSGDFSYDALKKAEPRNVLFDAFKNKKVIYCNMKQTPYYELAPVHPDLLLKDFIAIFHPELVEEGYEPTFYRLLK